MTFAGLAITAGLSLNLVLLFAIGAGKAGRATIVPVFQLITLFVSTLLLWVVYTLILTFLPWDIMALFLCFPLSALLCVGIETLEARVFSARPRIRLFSALTAYDGLVPASFILTVYIALNIWDALVLALFFALGSLAAIVFVKEIRRRASLEHIAHCFRGLPLALLSLGLLSMIVSLVTGICFNVFQN